jgi:hypothetical protein
MKTYRDLQIWKKFVETCDRSIETYDRIVETYDRTSLQECACVSKGIYAISKGCALQKRMVCRQGSVW